MAPGATFKLPKASTGINRTIYFYEGKVLKLAETTITPYSAVELHADIEVIIKAEDTEASILLLQGKPIKEQVMQYGPFVMNTQSEIMQAIRDYQMGKMGILIEE
jgi:redox-sensitive bicupin YhaK (pirin superfamily)